MTRRAWNKWTEDETAKLRALADAGYTLTAIADSGVFKSRSREGIANHARNIGLSLGGPQPEIDDEKFKQMMKDARRMKCI